jgi:WD40 repeat protein
MARLQEEGIKVALIDLTGIGSRDITPEQWYASIAVTLVNCLELQINFRNWWKEQAHLSLIKRLEIFIETILLSQITEPIVIFIDEIDSVLSLNFSTDDFFALIRACYSARTQKPIYQRLTFALLGVANPSDLIKDKNRTPFNIGYAIDLKGFTPAEASPLVQGFQEQFSQPEMVLNYVLKWTNGQPFLTQKICQLILNSVTQDVQYLEPIETENWLNHLVRSQLISYWELTDEPEHLRTIANRLLSDEQRARSLLGLYQKIITSTQQKIPINNTPEETELLLSGLIIKEQGFLKVLNPIYQEVFNQKWVIEKLNHLRPYSYNLHKWFNSDCKDESRLLQGQALKDAQNWAKNQQLTDQDYQFLAASLALEQYQQQQNLKASRSQEIEARLIQEKKTAQLQRYLLWVISLALFISTTLGIITFQQYQITKNSEVKALSRSAEALFASEQSLDALLEALRARQQAKKSKLIDFATQQQVEQVLRKTVYGAVEINRLFHGEGFLYGVSISPDGKLIATTGDNGEIKIWAKDGTLLRTMDNGSKTLNVLFSPDGNLLVASNENGEVKLWHQDGHLLWTWQKDPNNKDKVLIFNVAFSPDGQLIAISHDDHTVKLFNLEGKLIRTFSGHQNVVWGVNFSPDGKKIASASQDQTIKIWDLDGNLINTLQGHQNRITSVVFSPDGKTLISGDMDGIIKIWSAQGNLINTIDAHQGGVWSLNFSPDGKIFASTGVDQKVKLWRSDGILLRSLPQGDVSWRTAFSPDGQLLISTGSNGLAKIWLLHHPILQALRGYQGKVPSVAFSRDGQLIAGASWDKTVKLWTKDGQLVTEFTAHLAPAQAVAFHPEGKIIASSDGNGMIYLWGLDGTVLNSFSLLDFEQNQTDEAIKYIEMTSLDFSPDGQFLVVGSLLKNSAYLVNLDGSLVGKFPEHQSGITKTIFSPNGELIATASEDSIVKLWDLNGGQIQVLQTEQNKVWDITFSPDSQKIASAGEDGLVKLWDLKGNLLHTFKGDQGKVYGVTFSPDGKMIASVGRDSKIKIWQINGDLIASLEAHQGVISDIVFSPDGKLLVSGGWDNTAIVWNLEKALELKQVERIGYDLVKDYLQHHL